MRQGMALRGCLNGLASCLSRRSYPSRSFVSRPPAFPRPPYVEGGLVHLIPPGWVRKALRHNPFYPVDAVLGVSWASPYQPCLFTNGGRIPASTYLAGKWKQVPYFEARITGNRPDLDGNVITQAFEYLEASLDTYRHVAITGDMGFVTAVGRSIMSSDIAPVFWGLANPDRVPNSYLIALIDAYVPKSESAP